MKGTRWRKSRYFTLRAESHSPAPNEAKNAISKKAGSVRTFRSGTKPYHAISAARTRQEIRKSTTPTMTDPAGTIMRGKYTLVSRFALSTRELLLSVREPAKNCQGSRAA